MKNQQAREAKYGAKSWGSRWARRPLHGRTRETAAALLFNETSVLDLINTGVVDDSVDLTAAFGRGRRCCSDHRPRADGPGRGAGAEEDHPQGGPAEALRRARQLANERDPRCHQPRDHAHGGGQV